jgi:hypothetical protein
MRGRWVWVGVNGQDLKEAVLVRKGDLDLKRRGRREEVSRACAGGAGGVRCGWACGRGTSGAGVQACGASRVHMEASWAEKCSAR